LLGPDVFDLVAYQLYTYVSTPLEAS
jgi:hypothetical protein